MLTQPRWPAARPMAGPPLPAFDAHGSFRGGGGQAWSQRCWDGGSEMRAWGFLGNPGLARSGPGIGGSWRDSREEKGPGHRASGPRELPRAVPILLRDCLGGPRKAQDQADRSGGPLVGCTAGYLVGTAFAAGSDLRKARLWGGVEWWQPVVWSSAEWLLGRGLWGHAVKGRDRRWPLTAQQPLLGWGSSGQWVLLPRAPLGCQRPRSASCAGPCDRARGMGHGGASQAPGVHPGGGHRKEDPDAPVLGGKVTGFSLSRAADTQRVWWLRVWGCPHGIKRPAWGIECRTGGSRT